MSTHTPERLRCEVCDMPTLGDTLCNLHYEEQENTMSTHTPGKWYVTGSEPGGAMIVSNDAIIARWPIAGPSNNVANARLIAAAPALLEAGRALIQFLTENDERWRTNQFVLDMHEALRLAEGKA